jgi:S1-C subfamily serine protease
MDIEHLSKSQIVLLTLLVSFVTSIATGIVTVSLMDQAPPAIAQTVNRVIERTVEKVVPAGQTAAVVTQQKTVVVKESDLIAQAVDRVNPSIVRFYTSAPDTPTFLGLGVVLDASGTLVADDDALADRADAVAELSDGTRVRAFVHSRDPLSGIAYLQSATTTLEGKSVHWSPVTISTTQPVLGESVVALSGRTVSRIADGIITTLFPAQKGAPQVIDTGIAAESIVSGSPLIDTDGSLIGVSTSVARASSSSGFVSGSALMSAASSDEKSAKGGSAAGGK